MASLPAAFARPAFRRYFWARTISVLGTNLTSIALSFAILSIATGKANGAGALGAVLAADSLSMLFFLLVGGVLADRYPRRLMLAGAELLAAAASAAGVLMLVTHSASVAAFVVIGAVAGASSGLMFPTLASILPDLAEPAELIGANGSIRLSTNIGRIAGPLLAGLLIAGIGPGSALALDALSSVIAAGLALSLPSLRPSPSGHSVVTELRHGFSAFLANTWVWTIVACFMVVNACFGGAMFVLGPIVATAHYGGAAGWSLVLATGAVGSVVGAAIALRTRPQHPMRFGMLAALPSSLVFFALGIPLPLIVLLICNFVGNAGFDLFGVQWDTALQTNIEPELLGRVSSYDWIGSLAATPIGQAIAGLCATAFGLSATIIGAGFLSASVMLATLALPAVWKLTAKMGEPTTAQ